MLSHSGRTVLYMAVILFAAVLGAGAILKFWGQTPTTLRVEAVILALGVLGAGGVLKSPVYSKREMMLSGAILATGLILPAVLVPERPELGRELLRTATYPWLFLFILSLSKREGPAWCTSPVTLIVASAVLASGFTLRFLLF